MVKKLNRIGNSKGIILDKKILDVLSINDMVELKIEKNKLVICKPKKCKEG